MNNPTHREPNQEGDARGTDYAGGDVAQDFHGGTLPDFELRRQEERSRIPVCILFVVLCALAGCSRWIQEHTPGHGPLPKEREYEAREKAAKVVRSLSRLHQQALSAARPMSSVAVIPPPQRRITVIWTNAAAEIPSAYVTGLVGSTNLRSWYQVARLPYATSNAVTLSNRPAREFYRAYNAIAWQ